jgi:predicted amidophosphoribosyltransferase
MLRVAGHVVSALSATGWSLSVADCLAVRAGVRDSAGLDPDDRVRNLAGHLLVRPGRLPPRLASVVLIDDVITTGATAAGCSRQLAAAGIRVAAVLSLTATAGVDGPHGAASPAGGQRNTSRGSSVFRV